MKTRKPFFIVLLLSLVLTSCGCLKSHIEDKNCVAKIKKSPHLIKVDYSKQLYNNYNDSKLKRNIKATQESLLVRENYDPTQYVLVNIETLKCYLKLLEEVEEKNMIDGDNSKKITGIAIFLGANNDNELYLDKPPFNEAHRLEMEKERKSLGEDPDAIAQYNLENDIRKRMTVFFAPTFRAETGGSELQRQIPFYIKANNYEEDPYIGKYESLLYEYGLGNTFDETSIMNDEGKGGPNISTLKNSEYDETEKTTLILEELADMPPRTPNRARVSTQ